MSIVQLSLSEIEQGEKGAAFAAPSCYGLWVTLNSSSWEIYQIFRDAAFEVPAEGDFVLRAVKARHLRGDLLRLARANARLVLEGAFQALHLVLLIELGRAGDCARRIGR